VLRLLQCLLSACLSTLLLVVCTFLLVRFIPGSPFDDPKLSPQVRMMLEAQFHLNVPLWQQLQLYLSQWCTGQWGYSMVSTEQAVLPRVMEALQVSLPIGLGAFVWGLLWGSIGAVWTSSRGVTKATEVQNTFLRKRFSLENYHALIGFPLLVLPLFALTGLGVWLLGLQWGWVPVGGWTPFTLQPHTWLQSLQTMVLPIGVLSSIVHTPVYWLLREQLHHLMQGRMAMRLQASGLSPERIQWRHCLPLAYGSVFPLLGPLFASVLTGSFTVESMLGLPGLGKLTLESLLARDYTLLLGCISMIGILFSASMILFQWVSDLCQPHLQTKR
jgi:oligopeptide transport system permease protein